MLIPQDTGWYSVLKDEIKAHAPEFGYTQELTWYRYMFVCGIQ